MNEEETAGKLAVMEADVILKMAQAAKIADEPQLERLKLLASDISDRRKALVEAAKIENGKQDNERESA